MPNGKPGDHPFSDVTIHGIAVFGPVIDGLLRRVAETGGLDRGLWVLLMDNDPRHSEAGCDRVAVEAKLRQVLAARGASGEPA